MRKSSLDSQCRGDYISQTVRGVESTQLDLEDSDWFKPHGEDTREINQSGGDEAQPRNQSLINVKSVRLAQGQSTGSPFQCEGSRHSQSKFPVREQHPSGDEEVRRVNSGDEEAAAGKSYFCHCGTSSARSDCSVLAADSHRPRKNPLHHGAPLSRALPEQQQQQQQLWTGLGSDDTNKNALASERSHTAGVKGTGTFQFRRLLNHANNSAAARKPSRRKSVTNERGARRAKNRKQYQQQQQQQQQQATDTHKVIELPPNSILRITSRSALDVENHQPKRKLDKATTQNPVIDKSTYPKNYTRSTISSKLIKKGDKLNANSRSRAREVNKSNSSRYRVTPCPTARVSWCSGQGSDISFASKRTCRSTVPGSKMSIRSLSAGLTDGFFRKPGETPNGPGTKNVTQSKRYRRPQSRQSRPSEGFSHSSTRRHRRGMFTSPDSSNGASSSGILLDTPWSSSRSATPPPRRQGARRMLSYRRGRRGRRRSRSGRRSKTSLRRMRSRSQKRKRGRPRGSTRAAKTHARSKSWGAMTRSPGSPSAKAKTRSFGLFDTVSNLWRSYSFSRNVDKAKSKTRASTSSSCSDRSWVSRMLPGSGRAKYARQQEHHREKSHKYGRRRARKVKAADSNAAAAEAEERRQRRRQLASENGREKGAEKKSAGPSFICRIM